MPTITVPDELDSELESILPEEYSGRKPAMRFIYAARKLVEQERARREASSRDESPAPERPVNP